MHYYCFIFSCFFLLISSASVANQTANTKQALYTQYSDTVESYYHEIAEAQKKQIAKQDDITKLKTYFVRLRNSGHEDTAIAALINHTSLILDEIDSDSSLYLLDLLFSYNIKQSAFVIAQYAIDNGSPFIASNARYLLGLYYFKQNNFVKTFQNLSAIETSDALSPERRDYATLMFGIALQKTKKHRQAIDIYQRVPIDSDYYIEAQLNMAVANIRQGWWTDAHIAVKNAIEHADTRDMKESHNRSLMVLAYSQLQNEFYRNARNSFRALSLDSAYVNQALLGIGLCAMYQKDYNGALNAFSRLQKVDSDELAVLESYLLLPYTYERMGELDEASLLYSQAIAYYGKKKLYLENQLAKQQATDFTISQQTLRQVSTGLMERYQRLLRLNTSARSSKLKKRIQSLTRTFENTIISELNSQTEEKITKVQSYLSQTQYGLAKLYDNQ